MLSVRVATLRSLHAEAHFASGCCGSGWPTTRVRLAIERAARLRYSQWALGEIEQFQRQYADATGADDDEENIIRAAARELGPIDAELLLPAIGMLYQQVLSTAAQRLSDEDADLRRLLTAVAVTPKRGLE